MACGLRWPNKLTGSSILSDNPPGGVSDGHSIAFVGYTDDRTAPGGGTFRFRNSFGPNWGDHGYGAMSYAYVRKYANDAVWLGVWQAGVGTARRTVRGRLRWRLLSTTTAMPTRQIWLTSSRGFGRRASNSFAAQARWRRDSGV